MGNRVQDLSGTRCAQVCAGGMGTRQRLEGDICSK